MYCESGDCIVVARGASLYPYHKWDVGTGVQLNGPAWLVVSICPAGADSW